MNPQINNHNNRSNQVNNPNEHNGKKKRDRVCDPSEAHMLQNKKGEDE